MLSSLGGPSRAVSARAKFLELGWTASTTAYVASLVDFAAAQNTAVAQEQARAGGDPQAALERIGGTLALAWETLITRRRTSDYDALIWLAVLAGGTDPRIYKQATHLINDTRVQNAYSRDEGFDVWRALGPLAPLAWAAGLTLFDARWRLHHGRLDGEHLVNLAMDRGFMALPIPQIAAMEVPTPEAVVPAAAEIATARPDAQARRQAPPLISTP